MEIRIAIASDFHCHPQGVTPQDTFLLSDMPRDPTGDHPVASLLTMIHEFQLRAELLLLPGDITSRVNLQGLQSGWSYGREIATALQVSEVAATLGNHDIDSHNLYERGPFDPPRRFNPTEFPCIHTALTGRFWSDGFYILQTAHLRLLVINSVADQYNEAAAKRGAVSPSALAKIRRALAESDAATFQVALSHHHPIAHENLNLGAEDLMENGSELLEILEEFGFSVFIHGHKHHPRLKYAPLGASAPTVFAAGSLSAFNPQMLSNTRNLFHILELSERNVDGCVHPGRIHSWEFNMGKGWSPPNPKPGEFPAIAGFGCRLSADELVQRTVEALALGRASFRPWENVRAVVPQVDFLLPRDFEKYGERLHEQHGLQLLPQPPAQPKLIGSPT